MGLFIASVYFDASLLIKMPTTSFISSMFPSFFCRYILVDWLVEVTTMKDFSSLPLHVTVGCVDRYLAVRSVPKAHLQLLGIACMVVCTR